VPEPDLSALRAAVAKADAEIRYAVGRRLALAREIGEAKRAAGLPIRDYAAEEAVLRRWREDLQRLSVPPDRADPLARWLIEESVHVQEALGPGAPSPARSSDVLVVGGAAGMGAWLREFFRATGHTVGVVDPKADPLKAVGYAVHADLDRAARDADTIVVATPMRAAPGVYRDLIKAGAESEALIFDVLSIKQPILPWIKRGIAAGMHISSAHPLFGPGSATLSERNLLVLDCGDPGANARTAALFAKSSLTITELPVERHDALMAQTLGLPHVVGLLFGSVLAHNPRPAEELLRSAPTSFLRQAEASRVIVAENPQLSFDIQSLNPASSALFSELEKALADLRRAVLEGDIAAYRRQLEVARAALDRRPVPSASASVTPTGARPAREGQG
jgi:chorismate mutase / prephenate dehydrogenase